MSDETEDDDFTELVDPDITRVDVVGKAANGTTILIAKSAEGEPAGLFDGEFVRDLIAKAEGESEPSTTDPVTVTGSPTAVAAMMARIHGAPVRKAEKYDTDDRKRMAGNGQAMDDGSYPVADEEDLDNAIRAVGRGGSSHDAIRRHVIARAKALGASGRIPDNWASDGSLKQPVSKADGMTDPGSPAWEAQDADTADSLVQAILALRPRVQALAVREGTEVGAGHMEDLCDVYDLQSAQDFLMQAAKLLGGFAVSERAEAGVVAKATTEPAASIAAPSPQESTVTDTKADEATAAAPASAPADVAKSDAADALTEADYARIGRDYLRKMAAESAAQTSGAAASDDVRTIPGTETVQAPAQSPDDVAKSAATDLATAVAAAMAPVVKQVTDLATLVGSQSERVEKALAKPDDRRSPALNGATGEPGLAVRGNSPVNSPAFAEIRKALDAMPDGPAKEEAQRAVGIAAIKARFGG